MADERTFAILASRLSRYDLLHRENPLVDSNLAPHETLVLTPHDDDAREHWATLKPGSVEDLKRWIGVPESARRVSTSNTIAERIATQQSPV